MSTNDDGIKAKPDRPPMRKIKLADGLNVSTEQLQEATRSYAPSRKTQGSLSRQPPTKKK